MLLVGPPGTGKTLLSRAVAGEAGVPFFSISGSEFVEMFVGVGASRVRDLFDQAKRNSPCIVFVDEIDAVGRQRGAGLGGSHDEREQTLNQILVEMDGFDTNTNVIVIAATNRPDILDPALLRPGRFDRQVILDRPDSKGRKMILEVHTKGKPFEKDVELDTLAKQTPGFSGADLANLVNEAAILAARRNKKKIGMGEFNEAVDRVIAGPERKSRVITPKEKEIIAYHEGGHALVGHLLPNADPPYKVSIVSRGMAGGFTRFLPEEDRHLMSQSQFKDMLAASLGGLCAEELILDGESTTGPSDDLNKATNIARNMVTQWGMSERLGPADVRQQAGAGLPGPRDRRAAQLQREGRRGDRRRGPPPGRPRVPDRAHAPRREPRPPRPAGEDPAGRREHRGRRPQARARRPRLGRPRRRTDGRSAAGAGTGRATQTPARRSRPARSPSWARPALRGTANRTSSWTTVWSLRRSPNRHEAPMQEGSHAWEPFFVCARRWRRRWIR